MLPAENRFYCETFRTSTLLCSEVIFPFKDVFQISFSDELQD